MDAVSKDSCVSLREVPVCAYAAAAARNAAVQRNESDGVSETIIVTHCRSALIRWWVLSSARSTVDREYMAARYAHPWNTRIYPAAASPPISCRVPRVGFYRWRAVITSPHAGGKRPAGSRRSGDRFCGARRAPGPSLKVGGLSLRSHPTAANDQGGSASPVSRA